MVISFAYRCRLKNESNEREHFHARARRRAALRHQAAVHTLLAVRTHGRPKPPLVVKLTRVGRKAFDPDAVASSCKAPQDGICDVLGVDDGDTKAVRFEYAQAIGPYALRVEIEGAP
jgi:hypothetical protein